MGGMSISGAVLNQKGTPAMWSDPLVERPPFGYPGRLFINTTAPYGIYRDTGISWVLISSAAPPGYAQIISIVKLSADVVAGELDLSAVPGIPAGSVVYQVYLDGIQMGPVPLYNSVTKIMAGFDNPFPPGLTIEILMTYL